MVSTEHSEVAILLAVVLVTISIYVCIQNNIGSKVTIYDSKRSTNPR